MQLTPKGSGEFELKSRDLVIQLNDGIMINSFLLPGPGEYEIGGVMIAQTVVLTRLEVEDLIIGILAPAVAEISDDALEEVGAIDILMFHLGGTNPITPKHVQTLLTQVEASLIIPIPSDGTDVMGYCTKEMRCETVTAPYKITRSQLPVDGSKIITFAAN